LFIFTFAGHFFVPEDPSEHWILRSPNGCPDCSPSANGGFIANGMKYSLDDGRTIYRGEDEEYILDKEDMRPDSRMLTMTFNVFVCMNIFNMMAAKKINDELNFLEGLCTNCMFISIWIFIVALQAVMVQVGGKAMNCHKYGLTPVQWGMSLGIGASSLIVNFIFKFIPESICPTLGDEDPADVIACMNDYKALRRNRDLSNSQRFVSNKDN